MRILVHSNAPQIQSGYGKQCKLLLQALQKGGHDVACSAFYGVAGAPMNWEGITILPAGMSSYSEDVLIPHAQYWGAEAIVTLMDAWKIASIARVLGDYARKSGTALAAWLPIDCDPLSVGDRMFLRGSGATPIAMSRFGQEVLTRAGYAPPARMPHAVDTAVYAPSPDRDAVREALGVDGRFVVGICAANKDAIRKGWPEQFRAFAMLRDQHPEALLMVHSTPWCSAGYNLQELAEDMGLTGHVLFSEQYAQTAGLIGESAMAEWFGALDVLSMGSYAEAFGVPLIEAQACGTPVIATYGSAMIENRGAGLSCIGDEYWNYVHRAWWTRPTTQGLYECYEAMHGLWKSGRIADLRTEARAFALRFDLERVARDYWLPILGDLPRPEPAS